MCQDSREERGLIAFCFRESGKVGRLRVRLKEGFTKDDAAYDILIGLNAKVIKDKFIRVIVL